MKKKGFTLIELLLVIAVIITLALIAIPTYTKTKSRGLQKEAISNLKLIAAAERVYRMESGDYFDCSCNNASDCSNSGGCNTVLRLLLNSQNWKYSVATAGSAGSKSATISASVQTGGCAYTLSSSDFDTKDYTTSTGCL